MRGKSMRTATRPPIADRSKDTATERRGSNRGPGVPLRGRREGLPRVDDLVSRGPPERPRMTEPGTGAIRDALAAERLRSARLVALLRFVGISIAFVMN